jgi:hypothetical protein
MSDEQSNKPKMTYSTPSKILLLGAAAAVLSFINISAGGEAQPAAVRFLEYAFLTGGLTAVAGGLIMMMRQK